MKYYETVECFPSQQTSCLICHEDYIASSSLIRIMDCSHIYHSTCIEEWFKYNESCPICRKKLSQTRQPNLLQFILLFLSLEHAAPQEENDAVLYTYESQTLASTAFVCVFLSILLERYKTAAEYNQVKHSLFEIKNTLIVDNEMLPVSINISSRTSIIREIKHRQTLMRCQLLQLLWSSSDPYHLQEPPELPHGRAIYQHPYLQTWRRKIERTIDALF